MSEKMGIDALEAWVVEAIRQIEADPLHARPMREDTAAVQTAMYIRKDTLRGVLSRLRGENNQSIIEYEDARFLQAIEHAIMSLQGIELIRVGDLEPGDRLVLDDGEVVTVRETQPGRHKDQICVRLKGRAPLYIAGSRLSLPFLRRVKGAPGVPK